MSDVKKRWEVASSYRTQCSSIAGLLGISIRTGVMGSMKIWLVGVIGNRSEDACDGLSEHMKQGASRSRRSSLFFSNRDSWTELNVLLDCVLYVINLPLKALGVIGPLVRKIDGLVRLISSCQWCVQGRRRGRPFPLIGQWSPLRTNQTQRLPSLLKLSDS